ncbi:hypothetical protein GRI39_03500 [Altererythrobacter indicus]|uniref:Uncharacterized protein n=1 Tax=Altericroceibacterium indicum TaxID=374177 RepID=A0A845A4A2_9SPHN|nr:hypothetical protein [Altericroceibacterium indicum]MXP25112.1 hypothetical protein [Altericroceibacterium indicum]
MTDLSTKMLQDRALRDAARINVDTDIALLMQNIEQKSIGARIKDSTLDRAQKISAEIEQSDDPRAIYIVGGIAGLLTLWLARKPLFKILGWLFGRSSSKDPEDGGSNGEDEEYWDAEDELHPQPPSSRKNTRHGTSAAA